MQYTANTVPSLVRLRLEDLQSSARCVRKKGTSVGLRSRRDPVIRQHRYERANPYQRYL